MTKRPDWSTAASLPAEELDRLLARDRDEVDDNPPLTNEDLAALRPGTVARASEGPAGSPPR